MKGFRSTRSGQLLTLAVLLTAIAAAGCVAEATPPAADAGSDSPAASSSPTAEPSASASVPSETPVPTIGPAPSGDWTSLSWIRVQGSLAAGYPAIVPPVNETTDGQTFDLEGPNVELRAIYGGYLQLLWDPYERMLTPWLSTDAQGWRRGEPLDLTAWKADFAAWDKLAEDQISRDGCGLVVDDYAASPSGDMLRAHFACSWSCGGAYMSASAMWASPDGLTWAPLDDAKAFGKAGIGKIAGGSSGFIGLTANRKASWTSSNGRAWNKGTVPADAFEIADPVSIGSGFVIGGTIRDKSSSQIEPGDKCAVGEPTAGGQFQAVAWISSDGAAWQRNLITPTLFANATVQVTRVDDHTLVATVTSVTADADGYAATETTTLWLSHDGRTWTPLASPEDDWRPFAVEAGGRGLISSAGYYTVGQDGALHRLAESAAPTDAAFGGMGDMPGDNAWNGVVGPVGLLVTDGTTFWLGIPSDT